MKARNGKKARLFQGTCTSYALAGQYIIKQWKDTPTNNGEDSDP